MAGLAICEHKRKDILTSCVYFTAVSSQNNFKTLFLKDQKTFYLLTILCHQTPNWARNRESQREMLVAHYHTSLVNQRGSQAVETIYFIFFLVYLPIRDTTIIFLRIGKL